MTKGKKTPEGVEAGKRIKAFREMKGFSLAHLSREIRGALTGPAIGNYEQGTRKLNIRMARILGAALDAHPAYLLGLLNEEEHLFLKTLRSHKQIEKNQKSLPLPEANPASQRPRRSPSSRTGTY